MKSRIYKDWQTSVRSTTNWKMSRKIKCDKIIKLYDPYFVGNVAIKGDTIIYLVVAPKQRNKGYGSKLLSLAEKEILKKFKEVRLVPQDNQDYLREFYAKRGYSGFSETDDGYDEADKTWWEMKKVEYKEKKYDLEKQKKLVKRKSSLIKAKKSLLSYVPMA